MNTNTMTRQKKKGKKHGSGLLVASPFLLPSLIGLLIFSMMPLIISGLISLTDWNGLDQLTKPGFFQEHFIGLENYKTILSTPEFWNTLGNTAEYIILYIPSMLAASLLVAYLLSRPRKGIGTFRVVYYIPVLTSWVAASLIWKSVLAPQYGAMNGILEFFGIQGPGWLLDEDWAMPAIVLVSVWKDMGFFGLILLSGIVGINKTYYEAAEIDGASKWVQFKSITFPLIKPILKVDAVLIITGSLKYYDLVSVMTGGGPNHATELMSTYMFYQGFRTLKYGYAAGIGVILLILCMCSVLLSNFVFRSEPIEF